MNKIKIAVYDIMCTTNFFMSIWLCLNYYYHNDCYIIALYYKFINVYHVLRGCRVAHCFDLLKKNKIQLNKFWRSYWHYSAIHESARKELWGAIHIWKTSIGQREQEEGSCTRQSVGWLLQVCIPYSGWQGSIRQTTWLLVIKWFLIDWFKIPFLIPCTFSLILLPSLPRWWPSMWSLFLWIYSCSSCLLSKW